MVATRRGAYANSPPKRAEEKQPVVQATPSTARRTRRAQQEECQQTLTETSSQLENNKGGSLDTHATSTRKRCTRASRLHSPEQPCTPVGSDHQEDMSDVESLCSAVSDAEPPVTLTRARTRALCGKDRDHETSEVESSSSAVSAARPGLGSRRSTRREPAQTSGSAKAADGKEETVPEAKSESQRVTRSQRKSAHTQSSARRHIEDSELSEAESGTSSVSGRRLRGQLRPIPIHLDELSESSESPTRTTRRSKLVRGKTALAGNEDKKSDCESDGFESGPTYSLSTRTQSAGSKSTGDSESEEVEENSLAESRESTQPSSVVLEKSEEATEEESLSNDSKLESTVIVEDADRTLVEEETIQTSGEQESLEFTSSGADEEKAEKEKTDPAEDVELPGSVCDESEPAVITKDLQEELSSESKAGEASEMEMIQETLPPSEPEQNLQSAPVISEMDSDMAESKEKQEAVGIHPTPADEPLEEETRPSEEEKLEVQVTASQKVTATVESDSEKKSKDVVVQKTKTISLLDSSDEDEDEDLMSDEDDSESREERRREPSSMSEAASTSAVEGLFMIDTRPGQDADQQYFREEEEAVDNAAESEDEEFIDEEGNEDDDEDSKVLFFSRGSQLTEMSSRIDPGIRMKELGGLYISFDGSKSKPVSSNSKPVSRLLQNLKEKRSLGEAMKKSVIVPDFEKKDAVPPYSESKQALKLKHRAERAKSTGDGWFGMKAPEVTQELKGDLQVLKMRGSLDPKRFYKKNDRDGFPKYFQVGTVMDSPVDFHHSRVPKKERKRTMVEELLHDAEFRQKNKRKYQQIIAEKAAQRAGKRSQKKKLRKK
ncbi:deoxynucleotidyltransferase terminal-interacting protein 2 [Poecilia reticulata]|uniref:Deoxynucleotidyltransferase terminal interacting protein 2 n=1 Tax=Poecilia reticulata TaxID=8081 RepID=A0A3P9PD53_POERE|nr:PREDICTED: deoxynucleotidyltransferase terminal-interacting protein 2 [Poecilia reticulata]